MEKQEVIDLAGMYLAETDLHKPFAWIGDAFAHVSYPLAEKPSLKEFYFHGYGIINHCEWNTMDNPQWKRIDVFYTSLLTFPPHKLILTLQPQHIVLGTYQTVDREHEHRLILLNELDIILTEIFKTRFGIEAKEKITEEQKITTTTEEPSNNDISGKILKFPSRNFDQPKNVS